MGRLTKGLAAGLATFMLGGCVALDYKASTERYVQQFGAANPHTTRSVVRPDGLKISAREFGAVNKDLAPAIIMMHGFPDSQHLYDAVAPLLAKTRHVITFDFVGWGDSDKPVNHKYDVASLRMDLEAVVASFAPKSMIIVVHDLSGQPGIDWSLDNEQRVASLVLLNTYYLPMPVLRPPEAIARFSTPGLWRDVSVWGASRVDTVWQRGVEEQISKFFANPTARDTYGKVFVHQALKIRPAFFGQNAVLLDEMAGRAAMAPRLQQFSRPVSIIFGSDDPYLNAGVAKEFNRLFPRSDLHLIAGGAHYVQLDQPKAVADLILTAGTR